MMSRYKRKGPPFRTDLNQIPSGKVTYGFAGVLGAGCCGVDDCGAAGCCVGAGLLWGGGVGVFCAGFENCCNTDPPCSTLRSTRTTIASAQIMNITAHHVVACDKTVAAPRGPNAVWLPAPPNAPAKSAALPLCSSTTTMRTKQFRTKNGLRIHVPPHETRKPKAISPKPIASAMAHFTQLGISFS